MSSFSDFGIRNILFKPEHDNALVRSFLISNNEIINQYEIWLEINSFVHENFIENRYYISTFGRVYDNKRKIIIPQTISTSGYYVISFGSKVKYNTIRLYVHRVVLITFVYIKNFKELQVNHIDGNKLNNCVYNLEWVTCEANIQHAYSTGLNHSGENSFLSKYSVEDVHLVCKCIQDGMSHKQIAQLLNNESIATYSFISGIHCGERWKSISKDYYFPEKSRNQKYSNDEIHIICKGIQNGLQPKELAQTINIDFNNLTEQQKTNFRGLVRGIRTKSNFTRISKDYNF